MLSFEKLGSPCIACKYEIMWIFMFERQKIFHDISNYVVNMFLQTFVENRFCETNNKSD